MRSGGIEGRVIIRILFYNPDKFKDMSANPKKGHEEQQAFLEAWPIERLEKITLAEYSNLEKDDSFTYWLESKSQNTGSIWGGSSYKFGIYRRADTNTVISNTEKYGTDGVYAWYKYLGETKEEAWAKVKDTIISIAQYSRKGQFDKINELPLGDVVKWKIAFLYNNTSLIPLFTKDVLINAARSGGVQNLKKSTISDLQQFLVQRKPEDLSTLEYANRLWAKFNSNNFFHIIEQFLKQVDRNDLSRSGFPRSFRGLKLQVSFGIGDMANVPWIAILNNWNAITEGIYPIYLYFRHQNKLILAYGKSETNSPKVDWTLNDSTKTIEEWFIDKGDVQPNRFKDSFVHSVYDLEEEIMPLDLQADLDDILKKYASITPPKAIQEEVISKKTDERRFWLIAPGERARLWEVFKKNKMIALGWDDVGDLSQFGSREEIRKKLIETDPNGSKARTNDSLALWEFGHKMKEGDIVIAKKGRKKYLGFGIIKSPYKYDEQRTEYLHVREVDWVKTGSWPEEVSPIVTKTLTDITKYPTYLERLQRLIGIEQKQEIAKKINYWWLNANPKHWKITDYELGLEQSYTSHNERGNKRNRYEYFQSVKPGDLVIGYETSPVKEIVAVLEIKKAIHTDEDDGLEKITLSIQRFLSDPIPWSSLKSIPELSNCEVLKNNQGSLFKLSQKEFNAIINFEVSDLEAIEEYGKEDALKSIFFQEEKLDHILAALERKKNIILQGPPGTGKTFIAKKLAHTLMGNKDQSKIEMIQFHQSYAYEDFIQGYRPTESGNFKLTNGIFYKFCKRAANDPENKYFFIIDEINRGNLSKIFGELMLLIEHDKRGENYSVSLTYSGDLGQTKFFIPENVYLIGTMNTADRSLAIVDYALRRRFAFIDILPAFNEKKFIGHLIDNSVDEGLADIIAKKMKALNQAIISDQNLGKEFQIGHSYFCNISNEETPDISWYQAIIDHEIAPLLKEYWFDQEDKANSYVSKLIIS
jgi:5-methylcytosine-specific restriction protein B